MALSKDQWLEKLKTWLPGWFFESERYQSAVLAGLADLLSQQETAAESQLAHTFIDTAIGPYLDLLGAERGKTRYPGESDTSFRKRVRNILNVSNLVSIKEIVDAFLVNGEANISEDFDGPIFADRGVFLSRGYLFVDYLMNAFSIVVDNQIHSPYSFCDREHFMDRDTFVGTTESPLEIFTSIITAVEEAKAFGVLYRLVERTGA